MIGRTGKVTGGVVQCLSQVVAPEHGTGRTEDRAFRNMEGYAGSSQLQDFVRSRIGARRRVPFI